jgi:hypothetical protein
MVAEEITFAQFFFWNGIGAVGLGGYIWYDTDKKWKRVVGVTLTLGGALSSFLAVSKVNAFLLGLSIPSILGPFVLVVGWAIVGWDIYLKKRVLAQGPSKVLGDKYYALRSENEALKIKLKELQRMAPLEPRSIPVEQSTTAPTPPVLLPPPSEAETRIFTDEQPGFFKQFFDGHTSVQADALIQPYLGKWIRVSGVVINDISRQRNGHLVFGSSTDKTRLFLHFQNQWSERILILRSGSTIAMAGKILRVDMNAMSLGNCELIESSSGPSADDSATQA